MITEIRKKLKYTRICNFINLNKQMWCSINVIIIG